MKVLRHFVLSEFDCPCCGENKMRINFVLSLDEARLKAEVPFVVNSGYRCPEWNRKVGGRITSSHLVGCAADISCEDSGTRFLILSSLMDIGFNRIGIGKDFIHVDMDLTKVAYVTWLY